MNMLSQQESGITQRGRERLGKLIKKSLDVRGWTYRDLSERTSELIIDSTTGEVKPVKVSKDTIGRMCNGQTKVLHPPTLQKLAPFVFRLVRFDIRGGVEYPIVDEKKTYSREDWMELQAIAAEQDEKLFRGDVNAPDIANLVMELSQRVTSLELEVGTLKKELEALKPNSTVRTIA